MFINLVMILVEINRPADKESWQYFSDKYGFFCLTL